MKRALAIVLLHTDQCVVVATCNAGSVHARSDCHVSDSYACVVVVAPPPLRLVPLAGLALWLATFNYLKLH